MTTTKSLRLLAGLSTLLLAGACGQQDSAPVATAEAPEAPAATEQAMSLPRTVSPDDAAVFFISPADGDAVSNPVSVEFGLDGMVVVKAGVDEEGSGHHHLLVDTGLPVLDLPIPADANHIHFGDASTATELTLTPGEHTLQLLLGDQLHIPHDPPVLSDTITITVE